MGAEEAVRGLYRRSMSALGDVGGGLALSDSGAETLDRMKENALRTARDAGGFSEGVDYMSGVPALSRYQIGRMDTEEETIGWLEKNVGENTPENHFWARDPGGRFILTTKGAEKMGVEHKGAPVAINPVKLDWGDVAQFAGESGPSLVAGTVAGALTGGLGLVPALGATFGAGYAAKRADEAVEGMQGYQKQTPEQIHGAAMMKGAEEAGGEGFVRALRPIGRAILGPHRMPESPWNPFGPARKPGSVANPIYPVAPVRSTVDPARIAASKAAMKEGFRPSPGQVLGDRGTLYPWMEAASHWLFGDPALETNKRVALKKRDELLSAFGGDSPARYTPKSAEHMGEAVVAKVQAESSRLNARTSSATDGLSGVISDVRKFTSDVVGPRIGREDAGTGLQESIKAARRAFGDEMTGRFKLWGEANPGSFPTDSVKDVARRWLDSFPGKDVVENVETGILDAAGKPITRAVSEWKVADGLSPDGVKTLKALISGVGDDMSIDRMHSLRKTLSEAAYDPDIMPGIPKKIRKDLLNAVDDALDVTGLKEINKAYHAGAKNFDDAYILRLTRDAGKSGAVDPENVAEFAIKPGKTALIRKIKGIVPREKWEAVRRSHWDKMVVDMASPDGTISAAKLNREINKYGVALDEAYGHRAAKSVRSLAKDLLAVDGKIPVSALRGTPIVKALRARVAAQKAEAEYVEKNLVKMVTSGKYEPKRLVTALMNPDNARLRAQAKDIIGEGSPEWDQVRTEVAGRLMDGMIDLAGKEKDFMSPTITNNGLRKAIDKMGAPAVEDILGPHFAKRLTDFSNQLSVALTRTRIGAGAIMTSAIALRPTRHIGKIVQLGVLQRLTHKPWFIKWVTEGYSAKNLRLVSDNVARAYFHGNMEGLGNVVANAVDEGADALGVVPQIEEAP